MSGTSVAVQRAKEPVAVQLAPNPENPFHRMHAVFSDVARRAFDIFEGNGRIMGHDLHDWFQAERELLHPVNIELTENDAAFEIKAEVPGFDKTELEISAEPHRVVIAGKHESKNEEQTKGKVVRSEARAEQMLRVVDLPAAIDAAKVTATLRKNGILALTLPKVTPAQPVRITPSAP